MGNTKTQEIQLIVPVLDNYQLDSHTSECRVLRHKLNGERIEQHQLQFQTRQQLTREIHIYEFRKYSPFMVRAPYMVVNHSNQTSISQFIATLYVEAIPLRLSHIKDIPYPDMLHLLEAALRGFSVLYDKVGYFRIEEDMICISYQGKVKVWVDPKLEKATPNQSDRDYGGQEQDMISKILKISEANTCSSKDFETFPRYCRKKDRQGFDETIAKLYKYAKMKKMDIPSKLYCADQLIEKISTGAEKKPNRKIPCGALIKNHKLRTQSKSKDKNSSPNSFIRNQPTQNSSGKSINSVQNSRPAQQAPQATHHRRPTQLIPSKYGLDKNQSNTPTMTPDFTPNHSKRNLQLETKTSQSTGGFSKQRRPVQAKVVGPYFSAQQTRVPRIVTRPVNQLARTQTPQSIIYSATNSTIRVKFSYSNSPSSSVGSIKSGVRRIVK